MDSYRAYLRANLCRDGIERMRVDSLSALEGLSPASPYRATMTSARGTLLSPRGGPGSGGCRVCACL